MKQNVRIIGGRFRGKKIPFPDAIGLRPTPDRVRETVFNWLMNQVHNAKCLDAFAGSGALGFEAYSRGAGLVVLIEQSKDVFLHLKKTAMSFNADNLNVIHANALEFFKTSKETFDIIFLDPPFAQGCLEECLEILSTSKNLASQGLLYVESSYEIDADPEVWQNLKLKRAGQVVYGLYQKISENF